MVVCSLDVIDEDQRSGSAMTSSSAGDHYGGGGAGPSNGGRRPFLRFPPPPPYPPIGVAATHPSALATDYAYAYYEPGAPTTTTTTNGGLGNGIGNSAGMTSSGTSKKKHSYITRYGTEENIYEEIGQSQLEEEVRYVHSRHLQVLGELNLSVEAMIMPNEEEERRVIRIPHAVAALSQEKDHGEDLSPASCSLDSGFSGSSSGTNSLGRSSYATKLKKPQQKFWKKLSSLASSQSSNKIAPPAPDETSRCRVTNVWEEHNNTTDTNSSQISSAGSEHDTSSGDESNRCSSEVTCNIGKGHVLWRRNNTPSPDFPPPSGRLSRWFSIRRGSQFDLDQKPNKMPLLPEVEEETCGRRLMPPSLPPPPPHLTPQELKRRHIVAAIVHSENSYLATLHRLVKDYKKPLEEMSPPILSQSKVSTLFHRVPEILQCHTLFRIALAEAVGNWDRDHRIGDVFVASFSKSIVLDIYSGFINNFSVAMDLARSETKRKTALADFFKGRQVSSPDRLSFFGLMVKPVQRFPQFILFLQDLLHHTSQGHPDRMSLQLALTQLESLAELLNERKRESEQAQAFKEMLRNISGKLAARPIADNNRCLIRQDDVSQLEISPNGAVNKHKFRRLLLLNDLLVCVSVNSKDEGGSSNSQRLTLKWNCPISEIQVIDLISSPTMGRLLTPNGSLSSNSSNGDNLCAEMSHLMHDYQVISRMSELATSLKGNYPELNMDATRSLLNSIQCEIQRKDEQMAWVDSCCLQISANKQILTFQMDSPQAKNDWVTELRLARLALDPTNSPAWEVPEQEHRPSTKMPLFVGDHTIATSHPQAEVICGCFYTSSCGKTSYLWVCTTDDYVGSHIAVLSITGASYLKQVTTLDLPDVKVTTLEVVRASDTVWMGTDSQKLLIYSVLDMSEVATITLPGEGASVVQIKQHCDSVFVALANGYLLLYRRGNQSNEPDIIELAPPDPVSCILPINLSLYVSCGKQVYVLSAITGEMQKSFAIQHEHHVGGNINLMAHSGVGLWLSLTNSTTICLYHTETFKHLQDINVASNILRLTGSPGPVCVTALTACKGLLWVGTDAGISLTVPLPRLEGVPIISGRINVSYHAHIGPVRLLLPLQDPPTLLKRPPSKALACDVYGLYGQLMYVKNYDDTDLDKSHWSLMSGPEGEQVGVMPPRMLQAADGGKREQTLVTVTAGRGYINYQQPCCTNVENNAHIVLWELKL